MIQFNNLSITPDNKHLLIDASIEDKEYFKDIVIDQIIIDTQDTYNPSGPSSKAVYTYTLDSENSKNFTYKDGMVKGLRLSLDATELNIDLSSNLLFVYIIAAGTPAADTPCGADKDVEMSSVCNLYNIYQSAINYVKDLEADCSVHTTFIDFILRVKALTLSIKTGNYVQAIKYWNKFFKNMPVDHPIKSSCYE